MKTLCIIQARMGSTRLPGKVLKEVNGAPLLEYEIGRVQLSKKIDKLVVATTAQKADDRIEQLCRRLKIDCFRGSAEDVLDRYWQCSLKYPQYPNIVRLTGDCPLIDPVVIDEVITRFEQGHCDYATNTLPASYPDGMDIEIFTRRALTKAHQKAKWASEREHVTPYIRKHRQFRRSNVAAPYDFSHFRLVVDNPEDLEVISFLIKNSKPNAGYLNYIALLTKHPGVWVKNMHIERNEGMKKSLREDFKIMET